MLRSQSSSTSKQRVLCRPQATRKFVYNYQLQDFQLVENHEDMLAS